MKVTIIGNDGRNHELEASNGQSLMEIAVKASVPGIVGECGGACACATCHVYVEDAWSSSVGKPSPLEADMLDFAVDVTEASRLSCQIRLSAELDGLVIRAPSRQA